MQYVICAPSHYYGIIQQHWKVGVVVLVLSYYWPRTIYAMVTGTFMSGVYMTIAVVPEHRAWSFVAIMVVYCVELDVVEQLGRPDLGLVTNKGAIGKSFNGGGCLPITFSSSIVSRAEV